MPRTAPVGASSALVHTALLGLVCLHAGCGGSSDGPDDVDGSVPSVAASGDAQDDGVQDGVAAVDDPPVEDGVETPSVSVSPYVNGFVQVEKIVRDGRGVVTVRVSTSIDAERDVLIGRGEDLTTGSSWTSESRYDPEDGSLLGYAFEDTSDGVGEPYTSRTVYEQDERGLAIRARIISELDDRVATVEYDESGRQVERRTVDGGVTTFVRRYRYGADGLVTASATTYADDPEPSAPTFVTSETYVHDASGLLTGIDIDENDDGGVDALLRYEYDVDGNMVRLASTCADGALARAYEYRYEAVDAPICDRWIRTLTSFL